MLRVAVENLPPGSALHRKLRKYEWSQAEELAATLIDQIITQRWEYAASLRSKEDDPLPEYPDMYPRPWEVEDLERKRAEEAAATDQARVWFRQNIETQLKT